MTTISVNTRSRRRDLLRALGSEIRQLRSDAGLSQASVARVARIAQSHLSAIETGDTEPSPTILLSVARALGADLSIRLFPNTGPRIRDRHQVAIGEALIGLLHARWRAVPEVPVYRPVRGVIDLVLEDGEGRDTVATEVQSQLRRVEQQMRWAAQKADALAALPEHEGRRVGRLLVLRNTAAMREVAQAAAATLAAAYPAPSHAAFASLAGRDPWPGGAVLWAAAQRGEARILERPPRGVEVGR